MGKTILFLIVFVFLFLPNAALAISPQKIDPSPDSKERLLRPTRPPMEKFSASGTANHQITPQVTPQTKKAQALARMTEKRQNLIRAFFQRMIKRLEAAIARLEKLIARIESRLNKIQTEGKDVTNQKAELSRAKTGLTKAQNDLTTAKTAFENMISSNDPRAAFVNVRNTIKAVKLDLIEVHRILVHLIGDIQGLRVGTTKTTPTPTGGPTPTLTPSPTPTILPTNTPTI